MTEHLTDADLDTIEARANEATEGPWEAGWEEGSSWVAFADARGENGKWSRTISSRSVKPGAEEADADFIAAARSDVPALVAEVRRLRARAAAYLQLVRENDREASLLRAQRDEARAALARVEGLADGWEQGATLSGGGSAAIVQRAFGVTLRKALRGDDD